MVVYKPNFLWNSVTLKVGDKFLAKILCFEVTSKDLYLGIILEICIFSVLIVTSNDFYEPVNCNIWGEVLGCYSTLLRSVVFSVSSPKINFSHGENTCVRNFGADSKKLYLT